MSDDPLDMKALAKRYMDLWQEQVAAMAADPALAEGLAKGVAMMAQGPAAVAQAMSAVAAKTANAKSPANRTGASHGGSSQNHAKTAPASGTPSAAAASADPVVYFEQLTQRLAVIESRLSALEAQFAGQSPPVEPKPAKRRTKRLDPAG